MTPLLAAIDPWILAFSAITVVVTVWMGFRSAKTSKTASDFFVAGRSVSVGWNASAISGEYLSAASFMGVAGMVMSSGYDALWYPVCYACGYLFLLLFIAGPLRRFGAYTIPDFAEGRFDSPLFRKIAVVFVLFIGFFYTMPQMKGAGTTLAYVFQDVDLRGGWLEFLAPHNAVGEAIKGFPYSAGVLIVGVVITLNVALGGMKGITLVQAFQYWAKMFAISVPVFVLMAVYGHYGKQLGVNSAGGQKKLAPGVEFKTIRARVPGEQSVDEWRLQAAAALPVSTITNLSSPQIASLGLPSTVGFDNSATQLPLTVVCRLYGDIKGKSVLLAGVTNQDELVKMVSLPHTKTVLGTTALRSAEVALANAGIVLLDENAAEIRFAHTNTLKVVALTSRPPLPAKAPSDQTWLNPFGPLTTKAAKAAKLSAEESKPYSLLYTYSLIIALVCGTAGLPHILVRFYTNPDGVAAKRTTMWVMILIGVFYVFPPVFGVMGRNLLPELYSGVGAKGTDKVVLELPRILNAENRKTGKRENEQGVPSVSDPSSRSPEVSSSAPSATDASKGIPWGSILSGITCAGAFAAFMSTFSGLLVSMTGALAHDVYGRMLNPKASPEQRMKMFKWCAVLVGGVAVLLGMQVEPLQINFMVGQAFAIAAASYFPLLFVSVWWRKLTMKGAAIGMLTGGTLALVGISLTSFSDLKWLPLDAFWAGHPLLRILCEQPAIWTVPLAITLMIVVSKLTSSEVPADIRMKMLVLHAPEKLGLKQEYIQEHQPGH